MNELRIMSNVFSFFKMFSGLCFMEVSTYSGLTFTSLRTSKVSEPVLLIISQLVVLIL